MGKISGEQLQEGETRLKKTEIMINSMTVEERQNPDLLSSSPSRRRRIAKGASVAEREVSDLVSQFTKMRTMMQQMGQGQMPSFPGMGDMFGGGDRQPGRGNQGGGFQKKPKKKKGFGDL